MEKRDNLISDFKLCVRKLARSDLRLQLFRRNAFGVDITPLLIFEEEYNLKLKNQVLSFKNQVENAPIVSKQIFKDETIRRIRIQERNLNFHCPDCTNLVEKGSEFICEKGIDPAEVDECKEFKRDDSFSLSQHLNNQKGRLLILKEISAKEEFLFDFNLLISDKISRGSK